MNIFRHIIRGAGYLEGYGHHPGTGVVLAFGLLGGLAGVDANGLVGFISGFTVVLLFLAPMYCYGCIERSRDCDRDQQRLLDKIRG
jgi:hypothetical protein